MQGTLQVSGGTPRARPSIEVAIEASKLGKVAKKGKLPVSLHADTESPGVSLSAKLGKATIATQKSINLSPGDTRNLSLKLSKSGKSALRGKEKAKVKVLAAVPFGKTATAGKKLR